MWMHSCIIKALLSCHMCKAMRWKKGTSLAHETYYSLDLGFQISAEVQTMSQESLASQQDQQQNEAYFSCHRRLMGGFPLSNPACFCCLLIKTWRMEGSQIHDSENEPQKHHLSWSWDLPFQRDGLWNALLRCRLVRRRDRFDSSAFQYPVSFWMLC